MLKLFQFFKDKKNKFRFRLVGQNGEILAQSEAYESKQACDKGVSAIIKGVLKELHDGL